MNKLILCEGKTDAILLSYYLEKTFGWTHRNAPKSLSIKAVRLRANLHTGIAKRMKVF